MRTRTVLTDWMFAADDTAAFQPVTLPHCWNVEDASQEGCRIYRRTLDWSGDPSVKAFLEFGAVAGVCRLWVNDQLAGEHRGGYACFRFDITHLLVPGENVLRVTADNTRYDDISPLMGDFNNYGGIYREVALITTGVNHFDLLHYGTSGLDISTQPDGTVQAKALVVGEAGLQVEYALLDGEDVVARHTAPVGDAVILQVEQPHLWNGKADPHLYTCRARLLSGNECVDEVALNCGFRQIQLTPDRGLFLNGQHITLCGVAKHQDREGMGPAPTQSQLDEDMDLLLEIGANAVRLSHYQHPQYTYNLCDKHGLLVWAEIPMLCMPDGNTALIENARQQLTELILQNKHHPSIYCWGIQNEIAFMGESLEMYKKTTELDALARTLDHTRLTGAANLFCVKNPSQLNFIHDHVGYNIYFGWYYGEMAEYNDFFDRFHGDNPQIPLGVTEYGVDCSVTLHALSPKRKDYSEDFQALFHETVYPIIRARDYLWGSYVWNMFDFGSAIRNEGGVTGKNCKGLVTYDRKIKKDAFYFYKAWWSDAPFVYIAGRRFAKRCGETTVIKVYSNMDSVTLLVNGQEVATQGGSHVFTFDRTALNMGSNTITAVAGDQQDEIVLIRTEKPEQSYIYIDPNPEINVKNWFTMGQTKEDLFPADRFSIMDDIGTLRANPEAWALLEAEVPQIATNSRITAMPSMTLLRIINRVSSLFPEEFVKELNSKLNRISK